jgi:hypothetical protein
MLQFADVNFEKKKRSNTIKPRKMAPNDQLSPRLVTAVRNSLYAVAAGSIDIFYYDPQYSPDRYDEPIRSQTRLSNRDRLSIISRATSWQGYYPRSPPYIDELQHSRSQQIPTNPFDDSHSLESQRTNNQNPFDEENVTELPPVELNEAPYHIFSKQMKWAVIILIGVAGLFSGLSSNIYFPSLDAIARASLPPTQHHVR